MFTRNEEGGKNDSDLRVVNKIVQKYVEKLELLYGENINIMTFVLKIAGKHQNNRTFCKLMWEA